MGYYTEKKAEEHRIAVDNKNEEDMDEIALEKRLEQARETIQASRENDERWVDGEWIK